MIKKRVFTNPKGTRDFLPGETVVRNRVENVLLEAFELFGYQRIQTPCFEEFALLAARVGNAIREAMFTFESDRVEYGLRPEMTAPVCRVVSEGKLDHLSQPFRLYYLGQCFRYTRPGMGRHREFTQAGIELLGAKTADADAEAVALAYEVLKRLHISEFEIRLGNIGILRELINSEISDFDLQSRFIASLHSWQNLRLRCQDIAAKDEIALEEAEFLKLEHSELYRMQQEIGYDGKNKIEPQSAYDDAAVKELAAFLPQTAEDIYKAFWAKTDIITTALGELILRVMKLKGTPSEVLPQAEEILRNSQACADLDKLKEICDQLDYYQVEGLQIVLGMTRGLDFYTDTVFEVHSPVLGPRQHICGGGRYDRLVEEFGGPSLPAVGFAYGVDRLSELIQKTEKKEDSSPADLALILDDTSNNAETIKVARVLRDKGIRVIVCLGRQSQPEQVSHAQQVGCSYISKVAGKDEIEVIATPSGGKATISLTELAEAIFKDKERI